MSFGLFVDGDFSERTGKLVTFAVTMVSLAVGFTLIPILPGGLGVAEGSIEAMMGSLGVGAGEALVAAMLFRLCYYVAPALLSVLVLWGLKVSEPAVLREAAGLDLELTRRF